MAEYVKLSQMKIIALNVNSLVSLSKRSELSIFLNRHNPLALLLSETKLNKKHKIIFNGYNIIRTDRGLGSGGGTAIVLKNNIKYELINTIGLTNSIRINCDKDKNG